MLELSRRPAKLGPSINTRCERHGDEDVTAFDVPIHSVLISGEELNALLGDPTANERLYAQGTDPLEPAFLQFDALVLKDKIEGARVALAGSNGGGDIVLNDCKLKSVTLELQVGGLTKLSCKAQCLPNLDHSINALFELMNHEIAVEITAEQHGAQQALPLSPASTPAPGAEV